ncbi:MAG: DUF4837 family protein [Rikenellaceae bacterium]
MRNFLLLMLSICFFAACGSRNTNGEKYLSESKGNPYEIVLVAPEQMFKESACDTLRSILSQEVEMISRSEPLFDIITTVPSNLKNILLLHRNIIIMESGAQYDSTSIKVEYNVDSKPQMVVYMSGPNNSELTNYIGENSKNIVELFNREEQKRMVAKMTNREAKEVNDTIQSMFGFSAKIPYGYKVRDAQDGFLWISYETPATSQGFFIYSYYYDETIKFTQKYAIEMRNKFASLIPGPSDGSYMTTSMEYAPTVKPMVINGREWVEQRGFWEVENDFMGGPFVSYSTVERKNNRVIVVDGYLFSPRNNKPMRNLMRQLENVVYTIKIE